jgi:cystathionine beta-lyase family protein involved in aluminum resistance
MNYLKTDIVNIAEEKVKKYFDKIDDIKEFNQKKVLDAFIANQIGSQHFSYVTGYGHDDIGRDALDRVFAQIFKAPKAVVRVQFVSGTHALACSLFGNLRSGDKLISVAGAPYDTMEEVIGKRGNIKASLIGHGVLYDEIPLINDYDVDFESIQNKIDKTTTMILIQRSRGYSLRKSLDIATIEKIIRIAKNNNPDCICFVDNCYGEFVEDKEPIEAGADLIAGSLIKNPGGGIVEAGGYIAGEQKFVELASSRLTAPGIGSEGGSMFNQTRLMFQGIFMAPSVVAEAIKGAVLALRFLRISVLNPLQKQMNMNRYYTNN